MVAVSRDLFLKRIGNNLVSSRTDGVSRTNERPNCRSVHRQLIIGTPEISITPQESYRSSVWPPHTLPPPQVCPFQRRSPEAAYEHLLSPGSLPALHR